MSLHGGDMASVMGSFARYVMVLYQFFPAIEDRLHAPEVPQMANPRALALMMVSSFIRPASREAGLRQERVGEFVDISGDEIVGT